MKVTAGAVCEIVHITRGLDVFSPRVVVMGRSEAEAAFGGAAKVDMPVLNAETLDSNYYMFEVLVEEGMPPGTLVVSDARGQYMLWSVGEGKTHARE